MRKFPLSLVLGIGILLVFVLLVWWYWPSEYKASDAVVSIQKSIENPFPTYKHTLQNSPNPAQLFEEFSNLLAFSSNLPGWRISHINYQMGHYIVDLKPQAEPSSLQLLEKWLKRFGLTFTLKKEGAQFTVASKTIKRQTIPEIQNLDQVAAALIDQLKTMLPVGADIQIESASKKVGFAKGIDIKINLLSTSPDVLILLGKTLLEFSILIKGMDFSMENNLLSGSLELTVLGK